MRLSALRDPEKAQAFAGAVLHKLLLERELSGPTVALEGHYITTAPPPQLALMLRASLLNEYVRPALRAANGEAFIDFWSADPDGHGSRMAAFRSLLSAFVVATRSISKAARRTDSNVIESFVDAARRLGGGPAEECVRIAFANSWSAGKIVDTFPDKSPSNVDLDHELEREYSGSATQFNICTFCVFEAAFGEPTPNEDVLTTLFGSLWAASDGLLETSRSAARLRSVSDEIDFDVVQKAWGRPCEAMFDYLANVAPPLLEKVIRDESLTPGLRSRAAESAGRITDSDQVTKLLLPLLDNAPVVVQEGCVYALAHHMTPSVVNRLKQVVADPRAHAAIREAAAETLEVRSA